MMKIKQWATWIALTGLVVSAQAAVDIDFTLAEGYANGNLNGQNGWVGNNNAKVDATNGLATLFGYEDIDYTAVSNDVSVYDQFDVALEFSFREGYNTNGLDVTDPSYYNAASGFVTSVDGKPMMNVQISGNYTGVTERIQTTLNRNGGIGYYFRLMETSWNDTHFDGIENQWPVDYSSGTTSSNSVGIDVGAGDYISDKLKLAMTLTRGTNESLWSVNARLYNLDVDPAATNALIDYTVENISHTNLFLASHLMCGFGGGQSDSNARLHMRQIDKLTCSAGFAPAPPTAFVLWGAAGGNANIVTGSVLATSLPLNATYQDGVVETPAAGTSNYYPDTTGVTPDVNVGTSHVWPNGNILIANDAGYGDHLNLGAGGGSTNMQTMFVWENFLVNADTLQTLATEVERDDSANNDCWFRFIIKDAAGNWYSSDPEQLTTRWGFQSHSVTVADENWYDFTPITAGVASNGASASPDFGNIVATGVYIDRKVTSGWKSVGCRYFKATGTPDISVTLLEWGGASDIVDGSISNDSPWKLAFNGLNNKTFVAGQDHSPTNANYYPNRTGYSPSFNFTLNHNWGDLFVRDRNQWNFGDDYDFMEINHGGNNASHATNLQYMLVWDDFLLEPSGIQRFEAQVRSDAYAGATVSEMRFIFQDSSSNWYATASQAVPTRANDDDWTSFIVDAGEVQWYDFTPMVGGEAVIGASADPALTEVISAGIWYRRHVSPAQYGAGGSVRQFKLVGYSGFTATPYGLWAVENGVTGGEDDDDDGDLLSNFGEYVFGGIPTLPAGVTNQGILPSFDAASGDYMFSLRADEELSYYILTRENLTLGNWSTNGPTPITENDGEMDAYTSSVGTSENSKFIKLLVD